MHAGQTETGQIICSPGSRTGTLVSMGGEIWASVGMYVCMYVCYVCAYMYVCVCCVCVCVYIYIYIYICVCVCVYIYIYIYIYIHTYTLVSMGGELWPSVGMYVCMHVCCIA
jgi:hypothetical protein